MDRRLNPTALVLVAMAIYTALYTFFCIQRWATAYLGDPDYGLFNQCFWTTTHNGWCLYNTYEGGSHFRTHNSPIFFLILPFYALAPRVETMLLVQTLAVASGALAVYMLCRHLLDAESGVLLAIAYLCYHPLHGVNYDQFNELSFVTAPLIFAFTHLYRRRMGWFWVCAILAMGCKEDVPLVTSALGIYTIGLGIVSSRRGAHLRESGATRLDPLVFHGAALLIVSVAYFYFSIFVLFPYMRGGVDWPYFKERYGHLGDSFGGVVHTLTLRPWVAAPYLFSRQAVLVFLELVAPLAFLPLLEPRILLIAAPTWVVLQLSSFGAMHNTGSRYMAPVIACVFVAAVVGLRRRVTAMRKADTPTSEATFLSAKSRLELEGIQDPLDSPHDAAACLLPQERVQSHRRLRLVLVLTVLFMLAIDTTPLRFPFKNVPLLDPHQRARNELVTLLGPDASVSTQPEFFGKVSGRVEAYIGYHAGTEYILVDPTQPLWFDHAHWNTVLPGLISSGAYTVVRNADGALLLRRRTTSTR